MKHSDFEDVDFARLPHNNDGGFFVGVGFAALGVLAFGFGISVGYALGVFLG